VGRFDEYENLRKQGVKYADVRGYSYSRDDVAASNLATEYSQVLGQICSQPYTKPLEVELLICEVGEQSNEYFQVTFDGSVRDRQSFVAIGGDPEKLETTLRQNWKAGMGLGEAVSLGRKALTQASNGSSKLDHESLEIVLLDRRRDGRKFRRLRPADIQALEEFGELRT
jgi:proteasome alpha subunit